VSAFGPLLQFARVRSCESRFARRGRWYPQGAHAVAVSASLRLRCGARLGVAPQTHFAHFVRYVQTGAASQFWMRAARADSKAALLAATEIAPCGYHLPRCHSCAFRCEHHPRLAAPLRHPLARLEARLSIRLGFASQRTERLERGRRHPVGAISGATSSAGLGSARASAHPKLTRRVCLSVVSAANAASLAARPQAEQVSPDTNSPVDCSCLANGRSHRTGAACKACAVGAKRRPPQHEPPPGAACRAAATFARIADVQGSATGRNRAFIRASTLRLLHGAIRGMGRLT
jgi:hypothetical protein